MTGLIPEPFTSTTNDPLSTPKNPDSHHDPSSRDPRDLPPNKAHLSGSPSFDSSLNMINKSLDVSNDTDDASHSLAPLIHPRLSSHSESEPPHNLTSPHSLHATVSSPPTQWPHSSALTQGNLKKRLAQRIAYHLEHSAEVPPEAYDPLTEALSRGIMQDLHLNDGHPFAFRGNTVIFGGGSYHFRSRNMIWQLFQLLGTTQPPYRITKKEIITNLYALDPSKLSARQSKCLNNNINKAIARARAIAEEYFDHPVDPLWDWLPFHHDGGYYNLLQARRGKAPIARQILRSYSTAYFSSLYLQSAHSYDLSGRSQEASPSTVNHQITARDPSPKQGDHKRC